ncbi:MAG: sigma-70 family RNA polymerase sigma factor [Rhodothermales bacterium]
MPDNEITRMIEALRLGDESAFDRIFPLIYKELRDIAHRQLRRERQDLTLDTSAIVHEAYLNLVRHPPQIDWTGRKHFLAIAATAMRRILVGYARARKAQKRGGGISNLSFDESRIAPASRPDDVLALDEALERLSKLDERQARVVECRYFSGLTIVETAVAIGISTATVKRDWASARLWLNREIRSILSSSGSED